MEHCVGGAWHTVIRTDTGESYVMGSILPAGGVGACCGVRWKHCVFVTEPYFFELSGVSSFTITPDGTSRARHMLWYGVVCWDAVRWGMVWYDRCGNLIYSYRFQRFLIAILN